MSDPSEPLVDTEAAERAIDDVAEGAKQLVRRGFQRGTATGLVIGLAAGGVAGYFIAKRHMQTKYAKIADTEIAEMRQHYFEKSKALESEAAKRPLDEIVKEQGYSTEDLEEDTPPPMVVRPAFPEPSVPRPATNLPTAPNRHVSGEELKVTEGAEVKNIFEQAEAQEEWDWHEERKKRSPNYPYVIHYDERNEMEHYQVVTVTYYEGDNVVCYDHDENEIIDPDRRDDVIGEANLDKFGHGSGDPSVVFVRNDRLEMVFEVVRSPLYYAEEVHGFKHTDYSRNLERMRVRERDEQEE